MSQNLLKNVYLFKGPSPRDMEMISAAGETLTLNPGDDIFSQSDKATARYVIRLGSVKIHQRSSSGDNIEVANLGSGSRFGGMAIVDGEPRSASAIAREKTELVVLQYEKLRQVLQKNPPIAVNL